MDQLFNNLLLLVPTYGYPIIAGLVFAGSLGVPIPSEGILMAAGSLTTDGRLNMYVLIPLLTIIAVLADNIIYFTARKYGDSVIMRYSHLVGVHSERVYSLDNFLHKWGIGAVFISRWLLTPLGMPIDVLAGITKYPIKNFLIPDILGELLWISIFTYLGHIFGVNWRSVFAYIHNILGIIFSITAIIILVYIGRKIFIYRRRKKN